MFARRGRFPGRPACLRSPMKGLVFTLLQDRIVRDHGQDAWQDVLASADVPGEYEEMEDYPHTELLDLLGAAEPYTGRSGREAQRWFGRRALIQLAGDFYRFFRDHTSTVDLARAINDEIHPAVRQRYPGAEVPLFRIDDDPTHGDLRLRYDSGRGLCSFAEGLIEGTGNLYGEKVTIEQPRCVHEGYPYCDLVLTIEGAAGEDPFFGLEAPEPARRLSAGSAQASASPGEPSPSP